MIRICDAVMGSGKTSAAITYINEHPKDKFIYLTPYLTEATRIYENCPKARFCQPKTYTSGCEHGKVNHTYELVKQGRNITSTHSALMCYTPKMLDTIQEQGYTIIIDEALSVLDNIGDPEAEDNRWSKIPSPRDMDIMAKYGFVTEVDEGEFVKTDLDGSDCLYAPLLEGMESRFVLNVTGKKNGILRWLFTGDIFRKAKDVFVLTYLFKGSELESFMNMEGLQYQSIWISRSGDGQYRFSESSIYIPEYIHDIRNMIHLCESDTLNEIGSNRYEQNALSITWYSKKKREDQELVRLRSHIQSFFSYHTRGIPKEERVVAKFKDMWSKIKDNGYASEEKYGLVFNAKSKNCWSNRKALVYPVNVYPNTDIKNYYIKKGYPFDPDNYALSILVQWVWRSAIRNGEEIYLFLPSMRMRGFFTDWMDRKSQEGGAAYAS